MTDTASIGSLEALSSIGQRSDSSGGEKVDECDLDEACSHQEHLRLAGFVKGVHADLRNKYKKTGETELERIWYEHCQNKPLLTQYADAMHHLAVDHWSKNQETRIDWCRDVINEFFKQDGLKKVLDKEKRRKEKHKESNMENKYRRDIKSSNKASDDCCPNRTKEIQTICDTCSANNNGFEEYTKERNVDVEKHGKPKVESVLTSSGNFQESDGVGISKLVVEANVESEDRLKTGETDGGSDTPKQYNIVEVPVEGRIRLLDVGSCFNPFLEFPELQAVGIDISPATDSVFHCDFLHLRTTDPLQVAHDTMTTFINNLHDPVEWLPRECFHVIVFSLLLEYFPAPYQRWISCQKAHELLMYNGILVIVTPDSSHQNRNAGMMKSWKAAIESIGFKRWRYVKQEHLHCMVFRKVAVTDEEKHESFLKGITPDMIYIPQDFHNVGDNYESTASAYSYEDEQFYRNYTMNELPVPSSDSDEN